MFDEFEDMEDEFETITMTDEDGIDTEFAIMDIVEHESIKYFLVVDLENLDDDETEAALLKEVAEDGEDSIYEFVEDDRELEKIYSILKTRNDDYEIEL